MQVSGIRKLSKNIFFYINITHSGKFHEFLWGNLIWFANDKFKHAFNESKSSTGVEKVWPGGQIRPIEVFCLACGGDFLTLSVYVSCKLSFAVHGFPKVWPSVPQKNFKRHRTIKFAHPWSRTIIFFLDKRLNYVCCSKTEWLIVVTRGQFHPIFRNSFTSSDPKKRKKTFCKCKSFNQNVGENDPRCFYKMASLFNCL